MAKSALVLGGGGVLGISWATGMLAGLAEGGVDVTGADLIVGTSAGSVVGAQVARGKTLDELMAEQTGDKGGPVPAVLEFDPVNLMVIFQKWASFQQMTAEACAAIGAMAVASKTSTLESWLSTFEEVADSEWPERALTVTAVDADTGEFRTWDRASGAPFQAAVASSCTVPGLFPVVPINGKRYMDGGVRSTTNADLASGYERILVIAPIGSRNDGIDPLGRRISEAEMAALRSAGSQADLAFPDAASLEAMGINRMDAKRQKVTAEAGARQGEALAREVSPVWSRAAV